MLRAFLSIGVLSLLSAVATTIQSAEPTTTPGEAPKIESAARESAAGELVVGEPVRHANLTIFPVTSRTPRTADRFLTLDEGLKAGVVDVLEAGAVSDAAGSPGNAAPTEQTQQAAPTVQTRPRRAAPRTARQSGPRSTQQPNSANGPNAPAQLSGVADNTPAQSARGNQPARGNNVNLLYVVNRSEKPLYLMPGEIIIGGAQDRAIGQEYVIQPTKRPEPIHVFCVEHGRWGTRNQQELAALVTEATAQGDRRHSVAMSGRDVESLAKQANEGKFIGSVGKLSKGARIAVQEGKGQTAVWDEVGKVNRESSVASSSGAFTGNYAERDAVKRLDPYIGQLQSPVAETRQIVGVIVAVNEKMDSAEILESTPLFKKLWPKLLKSYALDAANAAGRGSEKKKSTGGESAKQKPCDRAEAVAFLNELQATGADAGKAEGGIVITRHVGSRLSTSTAVDPQAQPSAVGGMGGGFGGGIHSSGFSK